MSRDNEKQHNWSLKSTTVRPALDFHFFFMFAITVRTVKEIKSLLQATYSVKQKKLLGRLQPLSATLPKSGLSSAERGQPRRPRAVRALTPINLIMVIEGVCLLQQKIPTTDSRKGHCHASLFTHLSSLIQFCSVLSARRESLSHPAQPGHEIYQIQPEVTELIQWEQCGEWVLIAGRGHWVLVSLTFFSTEAMTMVTLNITKCLNALIRNRGDWGKKKKKKDWSSGL